MLSEDGGQTWGRRQAQFRKMLDEALKSSALQGDSCLEVLAIRPEAGSRCRIQSMLRRRGIRVTSITEHVADSPTGELMEAIIESADEFYSENLAH